MDLPTYRSTKKLSVSQMARMLGIDGKNPIRTLRRYETGERIPDRAMMRHIAAVTDNNVTDLDFPVRSRRTPSPAAQQVAS